MIVHLQVRKLLETSEIFLEGREVCVEGFVFLDFAAGKYCVGLCILESPVQE